MVAPERCVYTLTCGTCVCGLTEKRVSAKRIKDLVIGSSWSIPLAPTPMTGVG